MWWPLRATVVCAFYVLASSSCVEEGTAYKHRLLQAQPTLVLADWSACQEKCQQDPLCKGFTFKKPPVSGSGGCWILPQVDAKEADATAMSGPKSCETILTDSVSAKVGTIDTEKVSVGQSDSTMYVILGASIGTALLLTVAVCMMTPAKRGMARGRKGKSGETKMSWELYANMASPDTDFDLEAQHPAYTRSVPYTGAGLDLDPPQKYYFMHPPPP